MVCGFTAQATATPQRSSALGPLSTRVATVGTPAALPWKMLAEPARSRPPGRAPFAPATKSL